MLNAGWLDRPGTGQEDPPRGPSWEILPQLVNVSRVFDGHDTWVDTVAPAPTILSVAHTVSHGYELEAHRLADGLCRPVATVPSSLQVRQICGVWRANLSVSTITHIV